MATNASTLPAVAAQTWLGHPKGLFLLFATEMW
jgi:dipeptide/tripeptide permease